MLSPLLASTTEIRVSVSATHRHCRLSPMLVPIFWFSGICTHEESGHYIITVWISCSNYCEGEAEHRACMRTHCMYFSRLCRQSMDDLVVCDTANETAEQRAACHGGSQTRSESRFFIKEVASARSAGNFAEVQV
ncbi:hypothetical protein CY34DRAFT_190551 [Suillus luteus UH-Slu-Lm8-n1]|uniref:Unplaced genomic scaffold CY34scaffold_13, whole genome shotgun sequence n=1 Tax=Suillus luteus UH-Slu-Lm8-n1 TaxID=930992 RepID=A0A0D0B147_9AGAM|nr:hypothetical protein CY34DRAFT_190551 [Suillus luteus UH-Slu-Lm8-n1]